MGSTPRIFSFGSGSADPCNDPHALLGGKGAGLAEMARLGLPVPPGFTISTEVCAAFHAAGGTLPPGLEREIGLALSELEHRCGMRLGDPQAPLLLSVRSGARISMPGMMDTVLNLGLSAATREGLARQAHDQRFAWDTWRRFCALFANVVLGVPESLFEDLVAEARLRHHAVSDAELGAAELSELSSAFERLIQERTGQRIPEDPRVQLLQAVRAVFRSWSSPRAVAYRRLNGISDALGTAVTVQAMVFGNLGDESGTGVLFSRDPATGENWLYGEFLAGAQGEDVVAGVRTPLPIAELGRRFPGVDQELRAVAARLERHFRDVQDLEFTVQRGKLYVLQCRSAKRTGFAAVRIAVEMAEEGLISERDALLRVEPESLAHQLRPVFDPVARSKAEAAGRLLAHGLPAGPGAACGKLVFTAAEAELQAQHGERVILARRETSPEDIRGMSAAEGLLTSRGGMTSHAALVSRQMGKVAVVGCGALTVDADAGTATFSTDQGPRVLRQGDTVSLDGFAGVVLEGPVETRPSEVLEALSSGRSASASARRFLALLRWADGVRRLGVRANADQADQARLAVALGAEGIGLCRTEHMFFGPGKIEVVREMILASDEQERRAALARLLPVQRADFLALFRALGPRPCTVRTLDPPLHEFLPHDAAGIAEVAQATGLAVEEVQRRVEALHEANPMLGQRGCRLGIAHPEITEMQVRALFEAACAAAKEGVQVRPQIMIPLVGSAAELRHQEQLVRATAERVFDECTLRLPYHVGTMIELPRAALQAKEIAAHAEFFSFGTNDLTQTTLGLSRDDVGPVLRRYLELGLYRDDPFSTLDQDGVGELIRLAKERGRAGRPSLELGLCGEHGGDPRSIGFCHRVGLDYVSCSPLRIPIARLAAAQAALQ